MKKNRRKKKLKKAVSYQFKMPSLHVGQRILMYIVLVCSAAFAIVCATLELFPEFVRIISYGLAGCMVFFSTYYLVKDIVYLVGNVIKPGIEQNRYTSKLKNDRRYRTFLFAVPGATSNLIFAVFNGVVAIMSRSAWLGCMAAYYIILSAMRIGAVRQERYLRGMSMSVKRMHKEIMIYRRNSILFVLLAFVLNGMVIVLEYFTGGKSYPGFTIYAAAAYAFYKIVKGTINMIKERKCSSPLLRSIYRIGYVDACVSILILQTALLDAFGEGQELFAKHMNGIIGMGVLFIVLGIGVQGIRNSGKMLEGNLCYERKNEGGR